MLGGSGRRSNAPYLLSFPHPGCGLGSAPSDLGIGRLGFWFRPWHRRPGQPWASRFLSLGLRFLLCRMRTEPDGPWDLAPKPDFCAKLRILRNSWLVGRHLRTPFVFGFNFCFFSRKFFRAARRRGMENIFASPSKRGGRAFLFLRTGPLLAWRVRKQVFLGDLTAESFLLLSNPITRESWRMGTLAGRAYRNVGRAVQRKWG